jgi:hypothetical protein
MTVTRGGAARSAVIVLRESRSFVAFETTEERCRLESLLTPERLHR